ncbi:MAG: hypothetical protein MUF31_18345 [Akkermansiaceae bacterium]|jgi:hypothetical protein|nr:hypothetical protein [Akkermansiaceae bacterium]
MNAGRRQTIAYAAACALAGIGIIAIVSKCADSPPAKSNQSTAHPAKRERPLLQPSGPKTFEAAGTSETETVWKDSQSMREVRVRRTLVLTATPKVREEVDRATADITLDFSEGADLWDESQRSWRPMDQDELGRWFESLPNRNRMTYSATASITKVIDDAGSEPRIESVSAFGTSRDDPNKDWSMAENGMSVFLDWKDDQLVVKWSSSGTLGVEPITKTVNIPFSERFATHTLEGRGND